MNALKRSFLATVLLVSISLYAEEWKILQQGTDGYDGCEDVSLLTNTTGNTTHMAGWDSTGKDRFLLCQYKKDDTGDVNQGRTVIQYDLSPLPASIAITDASLSIYREGPFWNSDTFPNLDKDAIFEIREVTKSWDSSTATWDSLAQSYQNELLDSISYSSGTSGWLKFDVTSAITEYIADSSKNNGFMLFSNNEAPDTNTGSVSKFYSADFTTVSLRPMLTIYYEYVDTVPPTVEMITPNGGEEFDEGDVTHMIFSAQDNIKVMSRKVEFSADSGATWELLDSASYQPSFTWTIPAVTSSNCKIKVTVYDIGDNPGFDETDSTFTMTANIAIKSPQVTHAHIAINSISKAGLHLSSPTEFVADLMVYSVDGLLLHKVKSRQFRAGDNRINLGNHFSNGIYIIKMRGKGVAVSRKFVVKE